MAVTVTKYGTYNRVAASSSQGMPQINHSNSAAASFKVVLLQPSYTFDNSHSAFSQISSFQISAPNYPVSGVSLTGMTFTVATSGTATFDASDVVVTASGTDMSAAGAAIYYNTGNQPLMFFIDFGATETAGAGTTFNINWAAAGITEIK